MLPLHIVLIFCEMHINEGNQRYSSSDSEDDEESLIKYYFTRGFQYDAIVDFLSKRHGTVAHNGNTIFFLKYKIFHF